MANEFKVRKGLIVQGSGSTILDIQGSQGQLFSVTDSLSGSLFSVNDISGVPIMEVFSDNRVNLGTFNAEAIKVSGSFATMTGSLFGTASWANNSISASFSTNANNVNISTQDTTPTTYNVTFTGGASGMNNLNIDTTALRYTPSTSTFETPIVNSTTAVRGGNGSAASPAFSFSGDANTGIYKAAADTLGFSTGGSEKMRLYANGSLGINNSSSPQALLHLGATNVQPTLFAGAVPGGNQSGGYLTLYTPSAGGGDYGIFNFTSVSTNDGDSYGTSIFNCNAAEGFQVYSVGSGSGAGESSMYLSPSGTGITVGNSSNFNLQAHNNSSINIGTYTATGGDINLLTRSTSSLYIDTAQRVGIGTTSPLVKLHVVGTSAFISDFANIEVTNDAIYMGGKNYSGMYLEDGVASFGYNPSGDFRGVRANYTEGVWFINESGCKLGLQPVDNNLFSEGNIIQAKDVPSNTTTPAAWIKIYNNDDSSLYFMPVYK